MENKILYIELTINSRQFFKLTSTQNLQKDIDKIIEKNFKKGSKLTTSYVVVSEHGDAYKE